MLKLLARDITGVWSSAYPKIKRKTEIPITINQILFFPCVFQSPLWLSSLVYVSFSGFPSHVFDFFGIAVCLFVVCQKNISLFYRLLCFFSKKSCVISCVFGLEFLPLRHSAMEGWAFRWGVLKKKKKVLDV